MNHFLDASHTKDETERKSFNEKALQSKTWIKLMVGVFSIFSKYIERNMERERREEIRATNKYAKNIDIKEIVYCFFVKEKINEYVFV